MLNHTDQPKPREQRVLNHTGLPILELERHVSKGEPVRLYRNCSPMVELNVGGACGEVQPRRLCLLLSLLLLMLVMMPWVLLILLMLLMLLVILTRCCGCSQPVRRINVRCPSSQRSGISCY